MILILLFASLTARAAIIDYGSPQDILGHYLFDIYDSTGAQRGSSANPFFFKSPQLPATLGAQTLANSISHGIATDQFSLMSTAALQLSGNSTLSSIDAGIPAALGLTTAANSMPVVLASDQVSALSTAALQTSGNATLSTISSQLPAQNSYSSKVIQSNTSVQVKIGAGVLHVVIIGNNVTGGTLFAYDGTSASGTVLLGVLAGTPTGGLLSAQGQQGAATIGPVDIKYTTGLFIVTAGSTNNYFNVVYY